MAKDRLVMKEGRRALGSERLKNRPRALAVVYDVTKAILGRAYPGAKRIAPRMTERALIVSEKLLKGWAFNCQMCGSCILHSTGMTCPMTCPKNLRNGPCGGVRENGACEVLPDTPCIWVQAWERSQQMTRYANEMQIIQPPVDRSLEGTSAWANYFDGRDAEMTNRWEEGRDGAQASN